MTDYITIQGVRKRDFTIQARMPEMSDTEVNVENSTGEPILWDDETQVLWSTNADIYPRSIANVKKRSFVVQSKKR